MLRWALASAMPLAMAGCTSFLAGSVELILISVIYSYVVEATRLRAIHPTFQQNKCRTASGIS